MCNYSVNLYFLKIKITGCKPNWSLCIFILSFVSLIAQFSSIPHSILSMLLLLSVIVPCVIMRNCRCTTGIITNKNQKFRTSKYAYDNKRQSVTSLICCLDFCMALLSITAWYLCGFRKSPLACSHWWNSHWSHCRPSLHAAIPSRVLMQQTVHICYHPNLLSITHAKVSSS